VTDISKSADRGSAKEGELAQHVPNLDVSPVDQSIGESWTNWLEAADILRHDGLDPLDPANALVMKSFLTIVSEQRRRTRQHLPELYAAHPELCDQW